MRPLLIALHKYTGLALGLLLSLTGITGSLLVFDHALDEFVAPETVDFVPSERRAPLQKVMESARAAVGVDSRPDRLHLARGPGSPHVVRFPAPEGAPGPLEVSVAPTDAEVLAVRQWGEYPLSWVYRLHYTLLAGDAGKTVVGVSGLFLLFFCVSGLIIWLPRRGRRWPHKRRWRRAFTVKRDSGSFRLNYDLHKAAGFYLLLPLIVAAFSGVSLVFHRPVETLVGSILPLDDDPSPRVAALVPTAERPLTLDQMAVIGQQVFPGADLKRIYLPRNPADSYRLAFNQTGEPWSNHAASTVWIDGYSGEVLAVRDALKLSVGSGFLAWQFPLHNGDALGLPGRWLVFFCGWVPALLFGTGLYLWWRKWWRRRG